MADVELMIKIDEKIIQQAKCYHDLPYDDYVIRVAEAIANGTPLPKGHGALKDADAMINKLCTHEASEFFGSVTCAEILDFINDEKPIIEADKESENKE